MKKISFVLFILLACTASLSAQQLMVNTTRFVGGTASCGYSEALYSISTRDGGVLFVGVTTCYAGGGDIPPNFPDATGATPGNLLIGKLDSNLNVSWVKVYGGTQCDYATCAVQTTDGGYAVLATTASGDVDVSGNHGTEDLWLVRIDSFGNLMWQKCYGSPADEQSGAIALTPDNGFIMFGISNGSGGDVPTHYSGSQFDMDWIIVKTDSAGNKQWSKSLGGTGDESQYGSIVSANGGYYLVSSSNSTNYDCTDTFWHPNVNTGYDYYVFKLDSLGNKLWDSSYGGGGLSDIPHYAVWDNRDSSIVINGFTTSSDGYMITGYHGGGDMWVIKTDRNGTLKWQKCLGGIQDDEGSSISITPFGYMAYGSTNIGNIGHEDGWLFALDSNGNELADKQFGGINYEYPYSVFPFKNGYAATGFSSSSSFTEGANIGHLSGPFSDVFISYINYWPLGIFNVNTIDERMAIYPNPSNGRVRILIPNEAGNLTINNCIGESIYTGITKQKETIDINTINWASGIYIVKWHSENGSVLVKKLIKN